MSGSTAIYAPSTDDLLEIVNSTLGDISLSDDGERYLEDVLREGLARLAADDADESEIQKSEENTRRLAKALQENALTQPRRDILRQDIEKVLASICPIYPFC